MLTAQLEETLRRSMRLANERGQRFATTEHLLLALLDDPEALDVLARCGADPERLRPQLTGLIDRDLQPPVVEETSDSKPTPGYQRVIQQAAYHAMSQGADQVNGADVLAALFLEADADAVHCLHHQGVSRSDAVTDLGRSKGPDPR